MAVSSRLDVWRLAMELAVEAHGLSERLPRQGAAHLADQVRRSAASVPANIAEGNARRSRRDYLHLLSIARGSLAELHTHLELVRRLQLAPTDELDRIDELHARVGQMLTRLFRSLEAKP